MCDLLLVVGEREQSLTNSHGQDSGDDKEVHWSHHQTPLDRVLPIENSILCEEVENSRKASSDSGGDTETGEDCTQTFTTVPTPLDGFGPASGDTHTRKGRDDRVGGRDGHGISRGEHEPRGRNRQCDDEGQEFNTSIAVEDAQGNDPVLDGSGNFGTDEDGTEELAHGCGAASLSESEGSG